MIIDRRTALLRFAQFFAASPLLRADHKYSEPADSLHGPVNVFDFAKLAKSKLDPLAWDYMDEGSEDEASLHDNRAAFERLIIRPHFLLHDVSRIDISTNLFGQKWDHPIFFCPTGGKNCFFRDGEIETAYGAAACNTMMITRGIADAVNSGHGPKNWWQFSTATEYRSKEQMAEAGKRLRDQGCSGISVTVDIYRLSHRERSIRSGLVRGWCEMNGVPRKNGELVYERDDLLWTTGDYPGALSHPTPTWDTVQMLRENTGLPVIVKGIMTAEDTERALKAGMSGVIVSNHGARQLDEVGATIDALPECVEAAGGKMPVLIDGGFRRGTDIFKALALGASAVGIGRPYLWGLACFE
jgi:(S)-2-hydroxy-acid oxidase